MNIKQEYHKKPASKAKSPTSLLNNLLSATPSCRKAINFLIKYSCHYRNIYPSQRFIGEQTDVCRQTANEALKMAEELGFIESTYYHRQTKSYRIAFFFSNPFIRSALLGILPALSLFPIYGSLSSSRRKDDTNINYKNIYINSYSSYTKNSTSDELILKNREILRQEELKRERLTTNVHKFFYDDTYPGDIYEVKNHKREMRKSMYDDEAQPKFDNKPNKHRSNVSAYKMFTPELRPAETIEHAFSTMTRDNFMESETWQNFVKLMGKEEAMKWFEAGLFQATRKYDS